MDAPDVPEDELVRAFEDIALSNRWLGGTAPIVAAVADLVRVAARDGRRPVRVLDAACGGADVAAAVHRWASASGLDLRLTALDMSAAAVRVASRTLAACETADVVRGDVFRPPFQEGAFDVVHAGQFLHHVPREAQARTLAHLASLAAVGVVVSDLVRTRWAHVGIAIFGALTRRGRLFRHDGPLSVARGFTIPEAEELARAVPGMRVQRHPFSRLSWVAGPNPLS